MFFSLRIFIIAVCREDHIVANIEVALDAFNSISLFTHGTINGLESHNHLFFECGYSLEVWQQLKSNLVYSVTPLRFVINIQLDLCGRVMVNHMNLFRCQKEWRKRKVDKSEWVQLMVILANEFLATSLSIKLALLSCMTTCEYHFVLQFDYFNFYISNLTVSLAIL